MEKPIESGSTLDQLMSLVSVVEISKELNRFSLLCELKADEMVSDIATDSWMASANILRDAAERLIKN